MTSLSIPNIDFSSTPAYFLSIMLIVCGLLHSLALCSEEDVKTSSYFRTLSFIFLIISIFLFMILMFVPIDIISKDPKEILNVLKKDNSIQTMYTDISFKSNLIFTQLCEGEIRIQDCTESDQIQIFDSLKFIPYYDIAAILEERYQCAGDEHILSKYYFTDCKYIFTKFL